jgi:GTP-binding protein YchF
VGKTTLFNILTGTEQETDKFAASDKVHIGIASVPDPRLVQLRELFNPKKYSPATLEYVDIPGIKKGEGSESLDLAKLKTVDALLHVVRAFDDPELVHSEGDINPGRDIATIDLELILADHGLVERRLEKLEQSKKRGLKPEEKREETLLKEIILPALEEEKPLREIELAPEDELRLRGFQLLSAKPMLAVINVDESRLADGAALLEGLDLPEGVPTVVFSAPIEAEISRLAAEEQKEFLGDYGLTEPSLDRALRASLELLGLISFFTVGEDEVKAWTVRRKTPARRAAGAIHSDIERGFIRAEVTRWDDLVRLKTLAACRDAALLKLEGKEYPVQDGDVIHFRFNV